MCGISGIYNLGSSKGFQKDKFQSSLLAMGYRGPDAFAVKAFHNKAVLGHLRLSIIDLAAENNQPFQVDGRYWVIFNGEIYNYIELRNQLVAEGYTFRTAGDTEVLLRAYQHWGEDCVTRFNGMWAFAIYDAVTENLFCSRDRFGIKPFNYSTVAGEFIFSSEIKTILSYFPELKKPNYNVIANYCRKSTGAQIKETWFENIFRLEPAHNLTIKNSEISVYRYWDYPRNINKNIDFKTAVEEYKKIFSDAISLRMRSDVPVGFTLSSGIDSTSLVCMLKNKFCGNKNTYTAAFDQAAFHKSEKQNYKSDIPINEAALVKKVVKELDLCANIIDVRYDDYVNNLRKIIYHLESGHSSPAVLPLYQILQFAKKDVTVVLEGQGADELLGGYINSSMPIYLLELIGNFKMTQAVKEFKNFARNYSLKTAFMTFIRQSNLPFLKKLYYKSSGINGFFKGSIRKYSEIRDYPSDAGSFDSLLNKHLYKAHTGTLVDLLHYGDAISMSQSLESRLPFMDYRLVEFAFSLPSEYKIREGLGKYIHRKAMAAIVPDFILHNPIKFGFDSPLSHLFNKDGLNTPKEILLSDICIARGLFSKQELEKAFDEQRAGKKNHSRILYRMLSVELWFREFIDQ